MPKDALLGHGLALKRQHFADLLLDGPGTVDWFEVIAENFFSAGGRPWSVVERLRRDVPIAVHGTNLGLGNAEGVDPDYLRQLSQLVDRLDPAMVSDHLCFGTVDGEYAHDLLPLPHTSQAVAHVVEQIDRVQTVLQRRLLIENISTYVRFAGDEMSEAEFVAEVAERADCRLLLDVNNVIVNAHNHGFDPFDYLARLPVDRVAEIHLAGASAVEGLLIDTHVGPVPEAVWSLYRAAVHRFGPVPSLVEWDTDVPAFATAAAEVSKARAIERAVVGDARPAGRAVVGDARPAGRAVVHEGAIL